MPDYVSSRDLGARLCEVLGLDANKVSELRITLRANDLVRVEVVEHATRDEAGQMVEAVKQYKVVEA